MRQQQEKHREHRDGPAVPARKAKRGRGPKRIPLYGTLPNSVVWTPRYRRAAKARLQRWAGRHGKVGA